MRYEMAEVALWYVVPVLAIAVAVAVYWVRAAKRARIRADELIADLDARDTAMENLVIKTLQAAAETTPRPEAAVPELALPPRLAQSRFAENLRTISDRYAMTLRQVRSQTQDTTRRQVQSEAQDLIRAAEENARRQVQAEAQEMIRAAEETVRRQVESKMQEAIRAAEESTRRQVQTEAREATQAAVRSFGTSVVSLGADVSQVVSDALRRHRDDEVYETLTGIDHTVQQMIRQAQSYVILCGGLPGRRWPAQSFTDVVGGAMGRVRDYLRVQPKQLDRAVISRAVEPLVHTLATLLDNALRYSPPTSYVEVSFQEGHHGVTVVVDDAGVRMNNEQLEQARGILSGENPIDIHQLGPSPKVGFPGIAALAQRYGFSVFVDGPNAYGGMRAMVYVPETLLAAVDEDTKPAVVAAPQAPVIGPAPVTEPAPVSETPASSPIQDSGPATAVIPAVTAADTTGTGTHPVPEEDDDTEPAETAGGLPKRRRRTASAMPVAGAQARSTSTEPGRPGIAAAWHTGTKSGRAAATDHEEGRTS